MLAPRLQAFVSALQVALQRFIFLHYAQGKPCDRKLANILQFANFIILQIHRNKLRFSDKVWDVRNELGFTRAETPMSIVFLGCVSRNRMYSGQTETNVSLTDWNRYWDLCNRWDSAHKYLTFRQKESTICRCLLNTRQTWTIISVSELTNASNLWCITDFSLKSFDPRQEACPIGLCQRRSRHCNAASKRLIRTLSFVVCVYFSTAFI